MDNKGIIYQINPSPGLSRDGTVLDRSSYVDGQWVRFQRGRPRKMGGYKEVANNPTTRIRGAYVYSRGKLEYLYGFGENKVWVSTTTPDAASSVSISADLPGLPASDSYTFQCGAIFDAVGTGLNQLIIHPASNIDDIASETNTPLYYTPLGVNPATPLAVDDGDGGTVEVSGGVVVLQPYIFAYGSNGLIKNNNANATNDWRIAVGNDANEVNVAGSKIVKGLPIRGGANSPAGLFWALDSLIRVSRVGGEFRYDPVSGQSSILAQNSPIEYDGAFYWIGVDRFLMFNGTVQEVPNSQNLNWFFDNVNYNQRSKIWATKNTRFGEIWWFFPTGTATECTHAIIYNVRENCWYDLELARSAGYPSQVFRYPVMFDANPNAGGNYSTYVHEFGRDAIVGGSQLAIQSYFETSDFGYPTGGAEGEKPAGLDFWTQISRVEPDLVMFGQMSVQVLGEKLAQSTTEESELFTFDGTTGKIDMHEQRRQIRLRFTSNFLNGHYEMGRTIIHLQPEDVRS